MRVKFEKFAIDACESTVQYTFLKRKLHYVHETQKNIYHMLSHHTRKLEGLKM